METHFKGIDVPRELCHIPQVAEMNTTRDPFFSLVPDGSPHDVLGEREVMLPGFSLEIFATRKIRLQRWTLKNLVDSYWRLYCPVEGRAIIRYQGVPTELEPGHVYLIPPRTTFSAELAEPFSKWYVHFILGRADLLAVPGIYRLPTDSLTQSGLSLLAEGDPEKSSWQAAVLVLHSLGRLPGSAWTDQKIDRRVARAMDYLQSNLARKISADDAARAAGVSVRNLNHLFRSHARMTPMSVLLDFRLDRACHLLRQTDLSIEQVAEQCGFPNRYYFSRMLKQNRGISPAAYRKGQLY